MGVKEDYQVWSIRCLTRKSIRNNKHGISNLNKVLVQELHKPVIKKSKRRKVYAKFKDIIWAVD